MDLCFQNSSYHKTVTWSKITNFTCHETEMVYDGNIHVKETSWWFKSYLVTFEANVIGISIHGKSCGVFIESRPWGGDGLSLV